MTTGQASAKAVIRPDLRASHSLSASDSASKLARPTKTNSANSCEKSAHGTPSNSTITSGLDGNSRRMRFSQAPSDWAGAARSRAAGRRLSAAAGS
jgi:hypothetical protein